jgi:thiamine pyrophosphokinase
MTSRPVLLIGPLAQASKKWWDALERLLAGSAQPPTIVAVDGGVNAALKMGLTPHWIAGDWDSAKAGATKKLRKKGIPALTFPKNKNASDFALTAQAASAQGVEEILCLGFTGGRPDHHLAVLEESAGLIREGVLRVTIASPEGDYAFIGPRAGLEVEGRPGSTFSVFAWGHTASGVHIRGAKYMLKGSALEPSSLGLSNVTKGKKLHVSCRSGVLLVLFPEGVR